MTSEDVNKMLVELVTTTEDRFLESNDKRDASSSSSTGNEQSLTTFPTYLRSISCIMQELESIEPATKVIIERLTVKFIESFPHLPVLFHSYAFRALKGIFESYKGSDSKSFIYNCLYEGLIANCAYPISDQDDESVVKTCKNFYPLWKYLHSQFGEQFFPLFMEALQNLYDKLDLGVNSVELTATGDKTEQVDRIEESMAMSQDVDESLLSSNKSEMKESNEEVLVKANKEKDFVILSNLNHIFNFIIGLDKKTYVNNWMTLYASLCMQLISNYPEAGGLYKTMSIVLKDASADAKLDPVLLSFFKEIIPKIRNFEGTFAQKSAFELIFSLSLSYIQELIELLPQTINFMFNSNGQDYNLIELGLDCLNTWILELNLDRKFFEPLIPTLKVCVFNICFYNT